LDHAYPNTLVMKLYDWESSLKSLSVNPRLRGPLIARDIFPNIQVA
jgi:hypothetical protein